MYDLNSIDSETKYVLAHLFVEKRTREQCRALFKQIKDTCYKQILDRWNKEKHKPGKKRKPITFVSDGFENYKDGAKHYFSKIAKIVFRVPVACIKYKLKHNNNPIEKYNQEHYITPQSISKALHLLSPARQMAMASTPDPVPISAPGRVLLKLISREV